MNSVTLTLIDLLDQARLLLLVLDDSGYTLPEPMAMNATIGGHLRHVLEHIEPILDTPAGGVLDYDTRPRDRDVEGSISGALIRIDHLQNALGRRPSGWASDLLRLRNRVAEGEDAIAVAKTSRTRELIYAVAHTAHHFALIRVMCNLRGISLPESFGFAPSTMRHLKTAAAT